MHIVTSKTMAEQTCTARFLDYWIKLVSHGRSFFLGFCVLNFVFSLVATLGNLLAIRALMKTSTIPATVKKMFLSLRYQELVTPRRVSVVLVSLWLTSCVFPFLFIFLPKGIEMTAGVISVIGYVLTTVAYILLYKVVRYHQNQIYSQNQLQNAQTREAHRQRKSAYNSLFVSVVFLASFFPFLPCTILYLTNTSEISFLVAHFASMFLIYLNSSLNPFVYCWRYPEIRQIVKSTVKQIFHMNEDMS